jgi:hypothetical protein
MFQLNKILIDFTLKKEIKQIKTLILKINSYIIPG